ncbi:MAG: hypothetical protein ACP5KE_06485 [Candidatus Methanodesulfokora sp.]|nr:MAG: hypothetical protein C0200_03155 [Candidatus Korarchaeota archaeon]
MRISVISEIYPGQKALLIGIVVQSLENYIIVDDGTGKARVYSDQASKFRPKTPVLVAGMVRSAEEGMREIEAEAVVDVSGISLKDLSEVRVLMAKVYDIEREMMRRDVR